jgi:hypothetical protein
MGRGREAKSRKLLSRASDEKEVSLATKKQKKKKMSK